MATRYAPAVVLALIGGGALAAYLIDRPAAPPPGPALVLGWPAADIGTVPVGDSTIGIPVWNPSGTPRRVVGMAAGCYAGACTGPTESAPLVVPPGRTVLYGCRIHAAAPGPVEFTVRLYLDDAGIRQAERTFRAVAGHPSGGGDADDAPAGRADGR